MSILRLQFNSEQLLLLTLHLLIVLIINLSIDRKLSTRYGNLGKY